MTGFRGLEAVPRSTNRRDSLTADLRRAGYLRGAFAQDGEQWPTWLQTELVLSRPGLLERCAALLQNDLPDDADRIAARGAPAVALATALSIRSNVPLLFLTEREGAGPEVAGDLFPRARVVLLEDVVLTGRHALESIAALRASGLEVSALIGLVDREQQGRFRIEEAEPELRTFFAFRERELQL